MQSIKPQLIVVYAKKNRKNGNYLAMRLSEIGYTTTEWTDEQYLQNRPMLKSTQKIVFFEDSKAVFCSNFTFDFEKFGMRYGWRANQCVVDVNQKKVSLSDMKEIGEYLSNEGIDTKIFDSNMYFRRNANIIKSIKESKMLSGGKAKGGLNAMNEKKKELAEKARANKVLSAGLSVVEKGLSAGASVTEELLLSGGPHGVIVFRIKDKSELIRVLDRAIIELFIKYGINDFIGE